MLNRPFKSLITHRAAFSGMKLEVDLEFLTRWICFSLFKLLHKLFFFLSRHIHTHHVNQKRNVIKSLPDGTHFPIMHIIRVIFLTPSYTGLHSVSVSSLFTWVVHYNLHVFKLVNFPFNVQLIKKTECEIRGLHISCWGIIRGFQTFCQNHYISGSILDFNQSQYFMQNVLCYYTACFVSEWIWLSHHLTRSNRALHFTSSLFNSYHNSQFGPMTFRTCGIYGMFCPFSPSFIYGKKE